MKPSPDSPRVTEAIDEGAAPEESRADRLPLDVIFDLLSNERRRMVMRYLLVGSGTSTLGELAEYIASIENDTPESALTSSQRKRVYIALYQCHLPKMDDANVIDFDGNRKTVELGATIEQLTPYLSPGESSEPPPSRAWVAVIGTISLIGLAGVLVWNPTVGVPFAIAFGSITAVMGINRYLGGQLPL